VALKTFVPALARLAVHAERYITRHNAKLMSTLSVPQQALLTTLTAALHSFNAGIVEPPEEA
jgi:hypothetical protein